MSLTFSEQQLILLHWISAIKITTKDCVTPPSASDILPWHHVDTEVWSHYDGSPNLRISLICVSRQTPNVGIHVFAQHQWYQRTATRPPSALIPFAEVVSEFMDKLQLHGATLSREEFSALAELNLMTESTVI